MNMKIVWLFTYKLIATTGVILLIMITLFLALLGLIWLKAAFEGLMPYVELVCIFAMLSVVFTLIFLGIKRSIDQIWEAAKQEVENKEILDEQDQWRTM